MLRDYQEVIVDNIVNDVVDVLYSCATDIVDNDGLDENIDNIKTIFEDMLKARIEAYDQERAEQAERDLPNIVARAVSEYLR